MKENALEKYLSELKGSEGDDLFGPDASVFKVIGKKFSSVEKKHACTNYAQMRPGLWRGFGELIWASRTWLSHEQKTRDNNLSHP
jgi:hypothetical protein